MVNASEFIHRNLLSIVIALILIIGVIFRFSYDLSSQTLIHLLALGTFLHIFNNYDISIKSWYHKLLPFFFLCALFSFPYAVEKTNVRNELFVLLDCLLVSYLFSFISPVNKKKLLLIPVFVGFWFAVILIVLFLTNSSGFFAKHYLTGQFIININILSAFLAMCLPLSLILWNNQDKRSPFIISLAIFAGILLTKSRIVILVSFLTTSFIVLKHYNRRFVVLFSLILPIVIVILLYLTKIKGYAFSDRILWWKSSLNMFVHNPLLGVGWGNFGNQYLAYKVGPGPNSLYSHNILLQILSEIGIPGLFVFLLILFASLKMLFQNSDYDNNLIRMALAGAFLSIIAINLFDYSFYIPGIMLIFWILAGSGISCELVKRPQKLIPSWLSAIIILGLICLVVIPLLGSMYYEQGLFYSKKNEILYAEDKLRKSIAFDQYSSKPYNKLAEIFFIKYCSQKNLIFLQNAIEMQLKAISLFPSNAAYWSDLAWLFYSAGNKDKAVKCVEKAIRYDRFNPAHSKNYRLFKSSTSQG